jgi:Do/DeqQ family serine protease
MSARRLVVFVLFAAFVGGLAGVYVYRTVGGDKQMITYKSVSDRQKTVLSSYEEVEVPEGMNFVYAAENSTPAVVYVTGYSGMERFGRYRGGESSGSGVILTDDGYVVTNKHVVDDASKLMVKLSDNQEFEARLVGSDVNTDIALLKIDGESLPIIPFGNSDQLKLGEWVLAVGNPFDLESTVTAGIVSAKGRNMRILGDERGLAIESFIQTDAAVNPGNSGGALVNLKGELIGINTAIATRTGRYEGYSFAVPSTLVAKVVDDLLEFGEVRRGLLGVSIEDINADLASDFDLGVLNGVFISTVYPSSAAEEAGIETGDVIIAINEKEIGQVSELQEFVARFRPGDAIDVTYLRDGEEATRSVTLSGAIEGMGQRIIQPRRRELDLEGAIINPVGEEEMKELGINGGVRVTEITDGKWKSIEIPEGFIITHINEERIDSVEDLEETLERKVGEEIMFLGIETDGSKGFYSAQW